MTARITNMHQFDDLHASWLAFWIISLMHDNPLLTLFKNAYKLLRTASLSPGQKVVEVGCGPGFFTIPAAEIVGEDGIVYAVDVNPRAVKRVEQKMRKHGVNNIKPILGNTANSGLEDSSIDLAFVFGLRYIAGGLSDLISEMYRILKAGGILSFEKTTGSDDELVEDAARAGFAKTEKRGRIFVFTKIGNIPELTERSQDSLANEVQVQ
jgi:ubiquinone/menaquinone biosynthesis C-methylase UbiE